jgi:ATP-binding cassette subfamily C (CFTR/MRP) protein 4
MLRSVLRAQISFFDTNPQGRILNRFSADVGICDETLPLTVYDFAVGFFVVLGSVATAVTVLPFILLTLPLLLWMFWYLRRIFVATSRELKRLEGMGRSPIFIMLSESLEGISTIRTNGKIEYFSKSFETLHDGHTRAYFAFTFSSRWFAFQMDLLAFVLMSCASILAVLFQDQGWFDVDPAILGLSLTLLIQISTTNFPWVVRQSAEVTNQMVSVERITEFGNLSQEPPLKTQVDEENEHWPMDGSIIVKNLRARYRLNLPYCLDDVTFSIASGTRTGIVGRTGSGKSSLVQALFRILEADEGSIEIGGVNINSIGLHKLRTSMAVISQMPVLFGGRTLKENLDPFNEFDPASIRIALSSVQIIDTIDKLPYVLDSPVVEGGYNFSVGQRQLLYLESKILVLDEPTTNIDSGTDMLLQQTLKEQISEATIITVAHRLDTIIDYDRIIALNDGKVLEVVLQENYSQ